MNIITNKKMVLIFFGICWITYFSTYLGRLNYFAATLPLISAEGYTKAAVGLIGTVTMFVYGFGHFVNGIIADKFPPKYQAFIGILASGVLNIAMSLCTNIPQMVVVGFLNGMAQSMIWAAIFKTMTTTLNRKECEKALVNMSTTYPIAYIVTFVLAAWLISFSSWRTVFYAPGIFLIAAAFFWLFGISKMQKYAAQKGTANIAAETENIEIIEKQPILKVILMPMFLLLCSGILIQGFIKDGVGTWLPSFVNDTFNLGSVQSTLISGLMPFFSIIFVYLSAFLNKRFFKNELLSSAFMYVIAVVALLTLVISNNSNVVVSFLMLAIAYSCTIGVNTMLVSIVPLSFQKTGKISTINGILNSTVYIGTTISIFGTGLVTDTFGWNTTIYTWLGASVIGTLACVFIVKSWGSYRSRTSWK